MPYQIVSTEGIGTQVDSDRDAVREIAPAFSAPGYRQEHHSNKAPDKFLVTGIPRGLILITISPSLILLRPATGLYPLRFWGVRHSLDSPLNFLTRDFLTVELDPRNLCREIHRDAKNATIRGDTLLDPPRSILAADQVKGEDYVTEAFRDLESGRLGQPLDLRERHDIRIVVEAECGSLICLSLDVNTAYAATLRDQGFEAADAGIVISWHVGQEEFQVDGRPAMIHKVCPLNIGNVEAR